MPTELTGEPVAKYLIDAKILLTAWEKGAAKGLAHNDSIFNEAIEKKWVEQWLFFANSTRYASAMAGADYGAFANGRWYMSKIIPVGIILKNRSAYRVTTKISPKRFRLRV